MILRDLCDHAGLPTYDVQELSLEQAMLMVGENHEYRSRDCAHDRATTEPMRGATIKPTGLKR